MDVETAESLTSHLFCQYFTVKPKNGFTANSFEKEGKCYIGTDRLLPAKMFLEAEKPRGYVFTRFLATMCFL